MAAGSQSSGWQQAIQAARATPTWCPRCGAEAPLDGTEWERVMAPGGKPALRVFGRVVCGRDGVVRVRRTMTVRMALRITRAKTAARFACEEVATVVEFGDTVVRKPVRYFGSRR